MRLGWIKILLISAIIFQSCEEKTKDEKSMEESFSAVILEELLNSNKNFGNLLDSCELKKEDLLKLYSQHQYTPLWVSQDGHKNVADSLRVLIQHPNYYGINVYFPSIPDEPTRSETMEDTGHEFAQKELLFSLMFLKFLHHIKPAGDDSSLTKLIHAGTINKLINENKISELVSRIEPKQSEYKEYKTAVKQFYQIHFTRTDSIKKDSLFKKNLTNYLIVNHWLDPSQVKDSIKIAEGIKKFQWLHNLPEDGIAGKETINRMNMSPEDYNRIIRANFNRWRNDTISNYGDHYVLVNIPSFHLEYKKDGITDFYTRTITGTKEFQTPELTASIQGFTIYPKWHVPDKITKKEILPHVLQDTNYLHYNQYEIVDRRNRPVKNIDWSQVNEKNFKFYIRQKEGPMNALGVIKFIMPNKYDIYIHDTNSRYLFKKPSRALSHGCIRTERPFDLAQQILQKTSAKSVPDDFVQKLVERRKNRYVYFSQPIPVYVRYRTAYAETGVLRFAADVYDRDENDEFTSASCSYFKKKK